MTGKLAGEVREVQFEVQRDCPIYGDGSPRDAFPVWVKWPYAAISPFCGGKIYEVVDRSEPVIEANRFWRPRSGKPGAVCEHMGRLIE